MTQQQFTKTNNYIISFLSRNADVIFLRISKDSTAKKIFQTIETNVKKLESALRKSIWRKYFFWKKVIL